MRQIFTLIFFLLISDFSQAQPSLVWAKQFETDSTDNVGVRVVATDNLGNIYAAGNFWGTVDFDPDLGISNLTSPPCLCFNIFVTKFDINGNFIWAKRIGSPGICSIGSMSVDEDGNVYLTGNFYLGSDFDPGPTTYSLYSTSTSSFISKLDSSGNFVWAKQLRCNLSSGKSMVVDNGDLYLTGYFSDTMDVDPSPSSSIISSNGSTDIFYAKYDTAGNFVWVNTIGSHGYDQAESFCIDQNHNLHIVGTFEDTVDFDPGPSLFNIIEGYHFSPVTNNNMFIAKYDSAGSFIWAKHIRCFPSYDSKSVAVDALQNVYFTGRFKDTVDFDPGSGNFTCIAQPQYKPDIFIEKLDSNGSFVWARQLAGPGSDDGSALTVDINMNPYVTGSFTATVDFNPMSAVYNLTQDGLTSDGFLYLGDAKGYLKCVTPIRGSGIATGRTISLDLIGDIVIGGVLRDSVEFSSSVSYPNTAIWNGFIAKYSVCNPSLNASDIQSHELGLNFYPNPTTGHITINAPSSMVNSQLNIYNTLGKLIHQQILTSAHQQIQLQAEPGIYILQVGNIQKKITVIN